MRRSSFPGTADALGGASSAGGAGRDLLYAGQRPTAHEQDHEPGHDGQHDDAGERDGPFYAREPMATA
ncbi:hypothetical protein [Herbiconiux sp.]|uniref:hypothetical protein n=1 Tax=Herbiconiux sp. TaxID=1871186 RepID=UPI0025C5204F|nr:hypothetical protein [Herbiconiux sp.]